VNVNIYFKSDVPDEKIVEAKKNLESFSEVKSVEFISKEQALEEFKKNNANEPAILKSLEEIGDNPLLSYLVVKAQSPDKYDVIAKYATEASFAGDVSRVNYEKNKEIINKFNTIIGQVRKIGIILGSIFALVAILVTFNTVRITIYTHKEEIEIMRLVGASNVFIRLPFILEGLFYGVIASLVSMLALFLVLYFGGSYVSGAVFVKDLIHFYFTHWLELFFLQLVLGSLLGIVGSIIAMRKYLKV
jgi:cell division transport system permease protein